MLLFLASSAFLAAAFAAEAPKGPVTVTNFGKRGKVTFQHSSHSEVTKCAECHHLVDDGERKCGAAKCHGPESTAKAPSMKEAAHQKEKGKCYGCHFKQSKKATVPLKCKQCHAPKKGSLGRLNLPGDS